MAIENSEFSHVFPLKMVIFNSYVKLPEGSILSGEFLMFHARRSSPASNSTSCPVPLSYQSFQGVHFHGRSWPLPSGLFIKYKHVNIIYTHIYICRHWVLVSSCPTRYIFLNSPFTVPLLGAGPAAPYMYIWLLHNVAVEIWQGEPLDFLRAIRICGRIPSAQGAREIPKGPMDTGHLNQAATLEFHCTYTDTVM